MGCRQIKLHSKKKKVVFVEKRHKYLNSFPEKSKQRAFFALVSDEIFQAPLLKDVSDTDTIYYSSVQAIKRNSKEDFNTQYNKISKRKVLKNSAAPFIHDDFLIFSLIIGVLKFDCEKDWLLDVIRKRAKSSISTTFENLLIRNYQSKVNIQSIILAFLFLMDKSKINNEQLVQAYDAVSDTKQLNDSDFIRIINYRAFDIIIQFKLPRDTDEISRLLEFETRFKSRINVFTYITYNTILLLILFGCYKILHSLPEDIKSKINEVGIIIGLGGIGLFGNIIPKWKIKFNKFILNLFGYKSKNKINHQK